MLGYCGGSAHVLEIKFTLGNPSRRKDEPYGGVMGTFCMCFDEILLDFSIRWGFLPTSDLRELSDTSSLHF